MREASNDESPFLVSHILVVIYEELFRVAELFVVRDVDAGGILVQRGLQ